MSDLTLSIDDTDVVEPGASLPRLVRAMASQNLLAPPLIVELARNSEVVIGRGSDAIHIEKVSGGVRVRVDTDDDRMSREHARFLLRSNRWTLRDCNSKNGCYLNGSRVESSALQDGDRIELGNTTFVFREARSVPAKSPSSSMDAELPVLRTTSADLAARFALLRRVAASDMSILLRGATGTGKELVARAVHHHSGRNGKFIPVNCGALPATLVESQLFGHVKGAFSGADKDSQGLVRAADGGTLFLDEIAELREDSQVALLRVLQEGEVLPVGATETVQVDVRVVAATHRDLEKRIADGIFREDLYARLAGAVVPLPALRDRLEDLGLITAELIRDLAGDRADTVRLSRRAARALFAYEWPRNVRELRAALQLALTASDNDMLGLEQLPEPLRANSDASDSKAPGEPKRDAIAEALEAEKGNVSAAARRLGYSRAHFHRLMKRFDIDPASFRD